MQSQQVRGQRRDQPRLRIDEVAEPPREQRREDQVRADAQPEAAVEVAVAVALAAGREADRVHAVEHGACFWRGRLEGQEPERVAHREEREQQRGGAQQALGCGAARGHATAPGWQNVASHCSTRSHPLEWLSQAARSVKPSWRTVTRVPAPIGSRR